MIKKDLNTKQVGSLFGVDESTVRRWSLAGKIKSSSSAGGHRTFSYKNIMEFAKTKGLELTTNDDKSKLNSKSAIIELTELALKQDSKAFEIMLIQLYLNGVQLTDLMDQYIEKCLVNIQKRLDEKKISVAEEHIARKIVSKSLNNFKHSITNNNKSKNKNVLCLNLENDIPDLPIDMIQILLENCGFTVDNCGSHTSIDNLKILLKNKSYEAIFIYLCDRQCCTSTMIHNINKTNESLKEISVLGKKYNIKLFLGGPSFNTIDKDILKNYNQFTEYSESLILNKM